MTILHADEKSRAAERDDFITHGGWGEAERIVFPGDASTRSYQRLKHNGRSAILMDAPAAAEAPACPPESSPAEREGLGYNALARLAGPRLEAFGGIAKALTERGFSAPQILEADLERGFLLIEDLGDDLFARIIPRDAHEGTLYAKAVDTLAALYRCSFEERVSLGGRDWPLLAYDDVALHAETDLFLDWYAARHAGASVDEEARESWREIWAEAFQRLGAHAPGLVLRDYHAENLIHLPQRDGHAAVGLLDFQDALMGHPAYDLVSLIEDARRSVERSLAIPLKARFVEKAGLSDPACFDAAYVVLGAQRNAKILGIFVRLAVRDGKRRYLDMLPRVARHLVYDLQHPALKPLKSWFQAFVPDLFLEAHK